MKRLLYILSLGIGTAYSQQTVTLCDDPQTFFYSTEADQPGETEWLVDGLYYYGNPIGLTWSDTGTYVIEATHYALNCPSEPVTYTVTVKRCDELIYYVPNAFTPDGNEYNQTWGPVFTAGYDPADFHLFVVNRWGEIVWETYDAAARWDGTYEGASVQDGIYTWAIDFGDKYTAKRYKLTGHVTLFK